MIIVGAGIIGLSCAWRLAQAGVRITIFDQNKAGGEASGAAAGMLAPGGEFATSTPLAELALRSLALYPSFIAELQEESGMDIDYRRCGAIDLDASTSLPAQMGMGIFSESRVWRGKPARYYPDDSLVDPRDVTRALLIACQRRGVILGGTSTGTGDSPPR